jgi:hypothetical protein
VCVCVFVCVCVSLCLCVCGIKFSVLSQKQPELDATLCAVSGVSVAPLVDSTGYKSEGEEFDSRLCNCNFSLT